MTAAKTPPERVTLWAYRDQVSLTHDHDRDTAHVYVLASVVEKRERALREALAAPSPGLEAMARVVREARALCLDMGIYGAVGGVEGVPLQDAIDALDAITIPDAIRAAIAAADEGKAKPNE